MALNGTQAYALSKKYTEDSLDGVGALKGAPCTIKSYTHQNGRSTIVFEWTSNSGVVSETTVTVLDGTPIYEWQSGDFYDYSDLVIYASCFYRCITPNSDVDFDDTKWNELGSADGNYDIVQNSTLLPSIFTAADRKMYYSIEDEEFYFWNGFEWVIQKKLIQYDALPVASSTNVNEVVQYLGATSGGLTHGYFYECVEDSGNYSWNEVKVQDTHVEASETNGNLVIDGVETTVYDDTEIDGRLDDVEHDLSTSTATVTGNPLNFTTLTAQKANETVISLEPIQDLHGYDHPWPAGGGKNLLENNISTQTLNGITWTLQSDGTVIANGTATADSQYRIPVSGLSGNFYFNGCPSGGGSNIYDVYAWDDTTNARYYKWDETAISGSDYGSDSQEVNIPEGHDGKIICRIFNGVTVNNIRFQPMIRLATETDPTFAPYSNYCPIDGRTETSLLGLGKNWLNIYGNYVMRTDVPGTISVQNESVTVKSNSSSLTYFGFIVPAIIDESYTISYIVTGSKIKIAQLDEPITEITSEYGDVIDSGSSFVATKPYILVNLIAYNTAITYQNVQLELGSTATAYEPFVQSNDLTIQFGETVYGANVSIEDGTVTVTHKKITYDGDTNKFGYKGASVANNYYDVLFDADVFGITTAGWVPTETLIANGIINSHAPYGSVSTDSNVFRCYIGSGVPKLQPRYQFGQDSDIDTLEKANQWLATQYANGTPLQVVYKLAEPITIQLTPNEISLLMGVNNISTDGDGITLTYRDGKVATLGDLDSLNVALNDALQDTKTDLSDDITTAQNTANTALAYAQNKVYGMRIRESVESNPASIISYLADAVGMTPVHMDYTNNVFDYGSWEDAWFIKDCKPCILGQDGVVQAYLNKNDYTKDIYGNTVTIDENLTGANVMIEFPKIWYKIVPVVPTCCDADVFISPVKLDDDYKDFAYIAQDKTHKEHFYMPAYNGSIINDGTNDVLRSLSGQAVGNSKTGTVEIEMAQRNGTGWYTETFSQVTLINLLLMLIGKSTDTQTVFGRGIDTGSQTAFDVYRTGAGNTKGMFWGSNDGTQLVKVFGIENWWALQWRRFGGIMCVNGTFKYKMCWGQEDGSTTDNYNTDADGYVTGSATTPSGTSGDYITRLFFSNVNMIPTKTGATASTKYCDGLWYNNSDIRYALRGGASYNGAFCGAFALDVYAAVSAASWHHGAALSYT